MVSIKPPERPGTTIVAVSNYTPTSLTLRWKSVAGASGYVIHATAKGLNHSVAAPEVKQPAPVPGELTGLVTGLAPGV